MVVLPIFELDGSVRDSSINRTNRFVRYDHGVRYDASATRSRLVEAAIHEFAAHGLAGARVDRIADAAAANKRAIYDYFANKQGLFDTAVARVTGDLIQAIPLDENNLANYAGELFDYLQKHPDKSEDC